MNDRDRSIIEEIEIEKLIEQSIPESDPLVNYSVRDLITALYWTSKADLAQAITDFDDEQSVDVLWTALTEAMRQLKKFYPHQIANLIESCDLIEKDQH